MRNYKFRLSAMIPSECFHKLKKMTKPREKQPLPSYSLNITKKKKDSSEFKSLSHFSSSYFSNRLHSSLEPKILQVSPRNSLHKIQSKRKTVYKPSPPSSVSAGYNKKRIKYFPIQDSLSTASNLKLSSSGDIIIDMNNRDSRRKILKEIKAFDSMEKTYPATNQTKELRRPHHLSVKVNIKERECEEEEDTSRLQKKHKKTLVSSRRSSSANSPRIKLRVSSPRIQVSPRRSKSKFLDSFAVIKSSVDPKKDFRESMVEMIAENNIKASHDLEDLLACYLSLNPKEYHDLIIMVFVQVWFDVINSTFASK